MNRPSSTVPAQAAVTTDSGEGPCPGTCAGIAANSCPAPVRWSSASYGRSGWATGLSACKTVGQRTRKPAEGCSSDE